MVSLPGSGFTGAYQLLTTLTQACIILRFTNATASNVYISYDGVTDHDYVIANNPIQLPFQSNSAPNNQVAMFPIGTSVWIKGANTTGNLFVSGYYLPSAN